MRIFYTDHFDLPLPAGHFFPMAKYRLLHEQVAQGGPELYGTLVEPPAATDDELLLVHDADYLLRATSGQLTKAEQRRIGFPWSPQMIERSRRSTGATIAAARAALSDGIGVNLAGGTHHAFRDAGEGYCVFNDIAVAARVLQRAGEIRRAVVIDCDAHQGNGTASIFVDDETVFTFSIHAAGSFPRQKTVSDLDIAMPDGADDAEYLQALESALPRVLECANSDMAFYLSGADPFAGDRLGRLKLSKQGLETRDRLVYAQCRERGLPVAVAMGGGYARQIEDIVDIHAATVRLAAEQLRHEAAH